MTAPRRRLVFATHNAHKLREVSQMIGSEIELLSLDDIGCHEDIPETATTLEGNAMIKARHVKAYYGMDCFADDTGLEVEALGGAPGVYSARYAGEDGNAEANMTKLLASLEGKGREAQFRTAIVLLMGDEVHHFDGIVRGEIIDEREGSAGFGYDPIFRPEGHEITFAQMSGEAKNAISHRGRAIMMLKSFLSTKH